MASLQLGSIWAEAIGTATQELFKAIGYAAIGQAHTSRLGEIDWSQLSRTGQGIVVGSPYGGANRI